MKMLIKMQTHLKFNIYNPWKVTKTQKEAGASSSPIMAFRGKLAVKLQVGIP